MVQVARALTGADEGFLVKVIPFGERHFRRTLTEFVAHYHGERPHQGLGNALIDGPTRTPHEGRIRRRRRLGGVLKLRRPSCRITRGRSRPPCSADRWDSTDTTGLCRWRRHRHCHAR